MSSYYKITQREEKEGPANPCSSSMLVLCNYLSLNHYLKWVKWPFTAIFLHENKHRKKNINKINETHRLRGSSDPLPVDRNKAENSDHLPVVRNKANNSDPLLIKRHQPDNSDPLLIKRHQPDNYDHLPVVRNKADKSAHLPVVGNKADNSDPLLCVLQLLYPGS